MYPNWRIKLDSVNEYKTASFCEFNVVLVCPTKCYGINFIEYFFIVKWSNHKQGYSEDILCTTYNP